jgi:hypothetical protein
LLDAAQRVKSITSERYALVVAGAAAVIDDKNSSTSQGTAPGYL